MSVQDEMFGTASTHPTDRFFFALFPDADTAARMRAQAERLKAEHGLRGALIDTGRLHLTLHHLGDFVAFRDDIVRRASQAAASLRCAPFPLSFDRVASFSGRPGNRPLVLRGDEGLQAVIDFQRQLGEALALHRLPVDKRFTPHVTLAYDRQALAEQACGPFTWTATEFVLVHSLLGRHQHVVLGRWPLLA